jgi:hypothetical protein
VFDVNGSYGIGAQTSNVTIEHNTIRDVHLNGAAENSSIAGIMVDAFDSKGPTVVRHNVVTMSGAHGIVIRGHAERRPRFEMYDNDISVEEPYFPFAFTSQNVTNTVIRNNRTRGGRAGLAVLKPCCQPDSVEFHGNIVGDVSALLVTAQDVSAGMRIQSNIFCLNGQKGQADAGQTKLFPSNTFNWDCARTLSPPQQLRIH